MRTFSKSELLTVCEKEVSRLTHALENAENSQVACNTRKVLTAWKNCTRLISAASENFVANSEVYTKDRDFDSFNIGTVAEQVLFNLRTNKSAMKSRTDGYDHRLSGEKCEYKACLSHSSKNSPYTPDAKGRYNAVLLINCIGVYYIPADEAVNLVDKYGRFKPNEDYIDFVPDDMLAICDDLTERAVY